MDEATKALADELAAHGYSDAEIAKELRYVERVASENAAIGGDPAWNYGFHKA